MDTETFWTALGTAAASVGSLVAWRQLTMQTRHAATTTTGSSTTAPTDPAGVTVEVPVGLLPVRVRGRGRLLRQLRRTFRRPSHGPVILTGVGGAGKSTVAIALADRIRHTRLRVRRRLVWWVTAVDQANLTGCLMTVARQLGAAHSDVQSIAAAAPDAPDRLWALLERTRRRWLLVFDNADDPSVLARSPVPGGGADAAGKVEPRPGDGTGWVRTAHRGLVVVTSRNASTAVWGHRAQVVRVEALNEAAAAQVLLDWAPHAGNENAARRLAGRLGGLPLALHLAGSYLESDVAFRDTFADYGVALDKPGGPSRLLAASTAGLSPDSRQVVTRTWELSLDTLADAGVTQARPLLRLLSCFASTAPIPLWILVSGDLSEVLGCPTGGKPQQSLEDGLRELALLGLVKVLPLHRPDQHDRAVAVHPVIADINQAHLHAATDREQLREICQGAAHLMVAALDGLDADQPADWARYLVMSPHVRALVDTVAPCLDPTDLDAFVVAALRVVHALNWCGALQASTRLCQALIATYGAGGQTALALRLRHNLAWLIAAQGRWDEAEATYRDVLEDRRRVLGDDHPHTLASRHELAWVTGMREQWARAEAMYRPVLDARRRFLGPDHPDTLITWHELAWVLCNQGREAEAEFMLHDILAARRRVLGVTHARTLTTLHELAWAVARQDRWPEAERLYREALTTLRATFGEENPHTLVVRHELAWVLAAQGRRRAARAEYTTVLHLRQRTLGRDHPHTESTRQSLDRLRHGLITPTRHMV